MMVGNPNEATILNSSAYQSLKSQFSVLYQQADTLKRQAEESRQTHENMRSVSPIIITLIITFVLDISKTIGTNGVG